MESIARYLMLAGLILFLVGGLVFLAVKVNLPLGRLPGDLRFGGEAFSLYLPCATSILLSITITVIINVILRLIRK